MKKNSGNLNINVIVLVTLSIMISYWLLSTPKVNILKGLRNIQELPKLTFQTLTSQPPDPQSSTISKKAVVNQKVISKLSTQKIKNNQDLEKIGKDLDLTDLDGLDSSINQIETEVE